MAAQLGAESSITPPSQQREHVVALHPNPAVRWSRTYADALVGEVSATTSDIEEEYESDEDGSTDEDFDRDMDSEGVQREKKLRPVDRYEDLGEKILLTFPDTEEYEDDEARDIFDNGLEDDDSDSGSDASTTFEELSEPDIITRVVLVKSEEHNYVRVDDGDEFEDNDLEDGYNSTSSENEDEEEDLLTPEESVQQAGGGVQGGGAQDSNNSRPTEILPVPTKFFSELEEQRYQLLYPESGRGESRSLQQNIDSSCWQLLELEEIKRDLEERISKTKWDIELAENCKAEAKLVPV